MATSPPHRRLRPAAAAPILALGALLAGVGSSACGEPGTTAGASVARVDGGATAPTGSGLALLVSGGLRGQTTPAGRRGRESGGIAARLRGIAAAARGLGHAGLAPVVLDGGDHLFPDLRLQHPHLARDRAEAARLADALRATGARATVPGPRDLADGLEAYRALLGRAAVPALAANLRDAAGGSPFAGTATIAVAGQRLGLIGAVGPHPAWARHGLRVEAPGLGPRVAALRAAGARWVVVLAVATATEAAAWDGGADLVLVTDPWAPARSGRQARVLWPALDAAASASAALVPPAGPGVETATVAVELPAGAVVAVPDRGRALALLTLGPGGAGVRAPVRLRRLELPATEVERGGSVDPLSPPPRDPPIPFLGAAACKACHDAAWAAWRRGRHARAFQPLIAARQGANADCLPCHVTGFGEPGGPGSPEDPLPSGAVLASYAGVGCEACHGPGGAHVATPTVAPARDAAASCGACHVEPPPVARVLGPGHGAR